MTAHSFALPVIIFTTFWGLIGIAGPWFVPKGPNRGAGVPRHHFVNHFSVSPLLQTLVSSV